MQDDAKTLGESDLGCRHSCSNTLPNHWLSDIKAQIILTNNRSQIAAGYHPFILSGLTFCQEYILSGPKNLDTLCTILSRYLGNTWAPLKGNFGNTLAQLGQYLDTTWMILGQNYGNTLILIG